MARTTPERSGPDAAWPFVVATDGSGPGRAAVAAAVAFPWPPGAAPRGVVARRGFSATAGVAEWPAATWDALERNLERIRRDAAALLARRWPGAPVELVDRAPVEAIIETAERIGARAIVVGSRGYGRLGRLLLGSVSRGVVRRAGCPVLVVKGRSRPGRRLLLGLDGSPHAARAVDFVAALAAPRRGEVTAVRVVEPVRVPSLAPAPASVRATIRAQAEALAAEQTAAARQEVDTAAARLTGAGWRARPIVREGVPLDELLAAARTARADCLVLGARGVGGVERLLLGSVAEGALGRAPISVLLVR